jgi:orotate phosphoribosyltransferase
LAAEICARLAVKLRAFPCQSIISPALGGIIVGQEVGRSLGKRHIFVEKEDRRLVLRRGFTIAKGERFIVAEDVVTRGGRVQEAIDIVRAHGGVVAAVGVIVDRSGQQKPDFGAPFVSLIEMAVETFEPDRIPADLAAIPAIKPGSK